jgi:alpha-1,6-mannosyltransferase
VGFSCERLDQVLRPYLGESAALQRAVRGYNAWFVRQFDRVVCHSRYAAAELPGRPRIVPLGVDLARFRPECRDPRVVAELRGDGSLSLLYVGRLVREKRVGVLAGMMRRLAPRGYRLTVVGAGPESDALAGVPGARVLGFVRDAARLAALYASADIFVHPSPIETFGLGVLEALASGCRVVGAADGGVAELLPMGFSRVSGSNAAWAEAVERTARLAAAAASRRAREVAECYPWTATASALLAVHAELAAETARP